MDTHELGFTIAPGAGPLAAVTLIASSAPASVLEFGVSIKAITVLGKAVLGVPASAGTGSAGTALQPLDPADSAPSAHLVPGAFATTQPTAPANPLRQFGFPLVGGAGAGVVWGWDHGELIVPAGGQLVLWVVTGTATFGGYVKVSEGG